MTKVKEENMPIAERFKELMNSLNLSRIELSSSLNTRAQTIGDYCAAHSKPGSGVLIILAEKYGVNINWLLTGQGEMFANPVNREFNKNFIHFGDTLGDLLYDEELDTTPEKFAKIGGITEAELEAIISNKMQPPATALRKWAVHCRLNLNFLIAQIGHPLLTIAQYEQRGPLTWIRERNDEDEYPAECKNPSYSDEAENIGNLPRLQQATDEILLRMEAATRLLKESNATDELVQQAIMTILNTCPQTEEQSDDGDQGNRKAS